MVLYPTFGHLVDGGRAWRIEVSGTIYEPGIASLKQRLFLQLLRRVMDVTPDSFDSEIFRDRISAFISGGARGREVLISLGNRIHRLPKRTRRNGHFTAAIRISADEAAELAPDGWLDFRVLTADSEQRSFAGRALLLADQGTSVISDIDDTIKHSEVLSRRELLANTFLREFSLIRGMADRYRRWSERGAHFHYVSSSPWQLYRPLASLCGDSRFPEGTFHLRSFCLREHMLRRMLLRRPGKGAEIARLVSAFPQRKFILIGDSAEQDPELYGAVARRFPERVQAIYIRELELRSWSAARSQRAFRGLPPTLWRIFRSADELPGDLEPRSQGIVGSPANLAMA